jgi:Tol biopolymer transport system component
MMGKRSFSKKWKPKGQYIIFSEKEDDGSISVYSTDSVFWRDFFKSSEELDKTKYKVNKK